MNTINRPVITLDLDNTLWHVDPVIKQAERAMHEWMHTHTPTAARFYTLPALQEYKQQIAECYPNLRHQISQLRREVMRRVFMQAGYDSEQARALAEQAFAVFYKARSQVTLFDGALEALTDLAQDYRLIALTNGNADLAMIGIDHLFDAHLNAEHVGANKPDPALFHAAAKHAQCSTEQLIHIGDHPKQDIWAAQQMGAKTIWVNVMAQTWPASLQPADQTIDHLSQLTTTVALLASGVE